MKRRVQAAYWLFERSKVARYVLVWLIWPPVFIADRLRDIYPPASLRRGLDWARDGRYPPTIPTADKPAVVRRRRTG